VADADEVWGQDVEHEAAGELVAGQGEDVEPVAMCPVAPAETDVLAVVAEDAGVGDGDFARVARDVANDLLGAVEGRLGVDHPSLARGAFEEVLPEGPCEGEGVVRVGGFELAQELSPEDGAQLVVGEEETWITGEPLLSVIREAAAGDEAMDMGMQEELLGPGVEHGGEADSHSQFAMGELEQGFCGCLEEQLEGESGGPPEEWVQRRGDGEYGVKVGDGEEGLLLGLGPQRLVEGAAAWTMAVTTGVVDHAGMATPVALLEVTTEFTGAARDEALDDTRLMTTQAQSARVIGKNLSDSGFAPVAPTTPVGTVHLLRLWLRFLSNSVERA
jgi:hypothetical protein